MGGFNPLSSSRMRSNPPRDTTVDEDGWGADAPQVTRTQLEKVQSSYQPTKVNMQELSSQSKKDHLDSDPGLSSKDPENSNVVKGGYQPVGKVDIAAMRKQPQQGIDDRPTIVKGAYEPVGKVDIAAIRARAQPPSAGAISPPPSISPATTGLSEKRGSLPDRTAPSSNPERLTSLPKPKVANRFGSGAGTFAGTKAPTPGGFGLESKPTPAAPPVGVGRTFADQGGKTPAQLWQEKKARERGLSGASDNPQSSGIGGALPMASQNSGGGEWKSGYSGKSWAPVHTTRTGQSSGNLSEQRTGPQDEEQADAPSSPAGGVSAIRDRFKNAAPMGAGNVANTGAPPSPPALDTSNKPNAGRGIPIPGLPSRPSQPVAEEREEQTRMPSPPPQPPRSPTPPTPPAVSGSPIRVAMPVGRGNSNQNVENARDEQLSPPPAMPARSLAQVIPHEDDLTEEPAGHDPARRAGEAAAAATFGEEAAEAANPGAHQSGKRALVQYDYEKVEDNELELKEGEYVTEIEMVDDNWWMGQNVHGETGLFPSNYVELVEDDAPDAGGQQQAAHAPEPSHAMESAASAQGATAIALYDYEAAEGNELSFPEDAKITGIVSLNRFNLSPSPVPVPRLENPPNTDDNFPSLGIPR